MSDGHRARFRELGRELTGSLLLHLDAASSDTASAHLDDATHSATEYGTAAAAAGLTLAQTIEAFLRYWHYSGDAIKKHLRIDLKRLGTPEDVRQRFVRMMRTPGVPQPAVLLTLTLNDQVLGYTNINRHGPYDNYPHFHTYQSTEPAVLRALLTAARRRGGRETSTGIGAVMDVVSFLGLAARERCSVRAASTRDIEWDGETLHER